MNNRFFCEKKFDELVKSVKNAKEVKNNAELNAGNGYHQKWFHDNVAATYSAQEKTAAFFKECSLTHFVSSLSKHQLTESDIKSFTPPPIKLKK